MSELMVLLQALLLIAGWLLFVRAQTELRAQAARQSLTGELEALRQTVDALLQQLIEEAAQAEARIEARLRELEQRTGVDSAPAGTTPPRPTAPPAAPANRPPANDDRAEQNAQPTPAETFTPDSGYSLSVPPTSPYSAVVRLAAQGLSVPEIARQTGYPAGEVELILSLKRRGTEDNG